VAADLFQGASVGTYDVVRGVWALGSSYVKDTFALASVVWNETGDVVGLAEGLRDWASRDAVGAFWDIANGAGAGYLDAARGLIGANMLGNDYWSVIDFLTPQIGLDAALSVWHSL
jgi:hypothetical protein